MTTPSHLALGTPDGSRLAYVTKMFPRITETFVLDEIRAALREGVPVRIYSLLTPVRDERVHPEAEALMREVRILPQPSWHEMGGFLAALFRCLRLGRRRTLTELGRFLAGPTPRAFRHLFRAVILADQLCRDEVFHVHAAWAHTPASVASIASRITRIPWSMAAHAKDIHTSDARSLARRLDEAAFTLACSRAHADHLRGIAERHGIRKVSEIVLAHHGVDTVFFSPGESDAADEVPRILSVGRLVPKKGMETLLEAAALLRQQGIPFSLDIVGNGPLKAALERRLGELDLTQHVRLHGLMLREEVRDVMRRATCFVLPSRVAEGGDRDGIPNSLAEAMACGLPVVSTRLPSIEELVVDGESGLLVPPEDPKSLANALARVLLESDLRRELGWNARDRMVDRFAKDQLETARVRFLARNAGVRRILFLSADRGVPVRGGKGASIHMRSLIGAWLGMGVDTRVLTTNGGPADGPDPCEVVQEAHAGPKLDRLARRLARVLGGSAAWDRSLLRLADNVSLYAAGRRIASSWRPDVIYERLALGAIAGILLARRLGVLHVLEVNAPLADEESRHRGLRLSALTRYLERWVLRRTDQLIVVSPALESHARRLGVRPDRIKVIPNGVDPSLFHPGRDGRRIRASLGLGGAFTVGFAGTLKPWHGVAHLIRGFASAAGKEPGMQLVILGDGPERPALEALAREIGVAAQVRFVGSVPHSQMADYLAACDVLCAPYGPIQDFYFSPIKLGEYLAVGRPVIASRIGPIQDTAGAIRGVIPVEPGDEASLGRAIVELARDPERRRTLGRAAARSVWTWRDVATLTLREIGAARARHWGWPSARPLTVGYVLKMFPRFSETFILNEILQLEKTGVRTVIFSMKEPNEALRQPGVSRVRAPVHVLPPLRWSSLGPILTGHAWCLLRHPIRYGRTAAYVWSRRSVSARDKFLHAGVVAFRARRLGIEHLHAHFASGPARQAKFASMLGGIPFSFTAHAKDLFWSGHCHTEHHKLKKRVRLASTVVAISDRNQRFFETLGFHVPRGRVVRIYNGLDLRDWPFLRAEGRPLPALNPPSEWSGVEMIGEESDARPMVLAVGRLVAKKGFHVLVDAIALLSERGVDVRCWIAGDGEEQGRLRSMIRERRLGRTIQLLGAVPQDRLVTELYTQAHVLVQPSVVAPDGDQDGLPTVILESMATGLPVVATRVSGITEAVIDEETGLAVEPNDARALADAMERVLRDDDLANRLAAAARRTLEERFNIEENARYLVRLFRCAAHGIPRDRTLKDKLGIGSEPPALHPALIAMPGTLFEAAVGSEKP